MTHHLSDGVYIVWPEYKWVPAAKIAVWYDDAVANGDVKADPSDITTWDKVMQLSSAGLITLQKRGH